MSGFKTFEGARRANERNGYKCFQPGSTFSEEKILTRIFAGQYFVTAAPGFNGIGLEYPIRQIALDGSVWHVPGATFRTFAEALAELRWIIRNENERKAFEARCKTNRAAKPRRSRSRAFDETAHYRCLG